MVYSVAVHGVLNSNQPFDVCFLVPAQTAAEAVRMLDAEMDWSEAKTLNMAAALARDEDIPRAAHERIVRL